MLDDEARCLWCALIAAYSEQDKHNHTKAAGVAGCDMQTAWRIYHTGFARAKLPPIKDIVCAQQAENRAIRGSGGEQSLRLVDAQADARRVAFAEGQMIAASNTGVAKYVDELQRMMMDVVPVMARMRLDISALADDSNEDGSAVTYGQRREAVREMAWLQKEGMRMIKAGMDLERKFNNEPTAIIGVDLGSDVGELLRSAMESVVVLENIAGLIDVTPETETKH